MKLIPDWFVTSKMIKELYTALCVDENMLYFNEDSGNVEFSCNEMGILNIDLDNVNLDNNFDEDYPNTIFLIRLLAWYKQSTEKIISEELMPIAWHFKRWRNFCMSEDQKKEIEPIFTE